MLKMEMCSRCHKRVAVVYISHIENGKTTSEGICLKCAKEIGITSVGDIMKKMGISDEDLDRVDDEMTEMFGQMEDGADTGIAPADGDIEEGRAPTIDFQRLFGMPDRSQPPQPQRGRDQKKEKDRPKRKYIDQYCQSLNRKAMDGRLDTIVGRAKELDRVIQILCRRQKNNPCLIGEPGVGKTAIAEALAERIVAGKVPYKLKDKEVCLVDLTAIVAGTQFRGQFESRMKGLIEETKALGNIILVIDEVHSIVGAGDAEGSMNAANILKPALSRGEIQVIGATTFAEYRKHIEKDSALERRFQPVTVNEPSIEDSIAILRGIAHYYEDYHGVEIPDDMCEKAVVMSERYITDRFLPDKAIDLLDEACSDVNLKDPDINRRMLVERELENIRFEADALLADNAHRNDSDTREQTEARYARIAELRSKELRLSQEQQELHAKGRPKLTVDNLARIIELWTKIPASSVKEDELERLAGLDTRLKEHIIGQDEAVDAVCAAIRRGRVGLKVKRKPVSFIFVGGSGVGKTELVKRLAADMFDSPESLIRLDMSEFMEKFSVSRIIGSPPGYVGYDEAGQLTEKIRRKPYSVVLFDEIEKAHPDVMNILLQILDDGRITDAQGRTVNFENTIIIMTTNAGSNTKTTSVGFGGTVSDMSRDRALKALSEFLRPEFLNRVDEVICFNSLTEENFADIAVLMLNEVRDVMKSRDLTLSWDESVPAWLVKKGYSTVYGARNLRRLIQKEVEDTVAARIVEARGTPLSEIRLTADESGIRCDMSPALPAERAASSPDASAAE